jgi:hypothetical protein
MFGDLLEGLGGVGAVINARGLVCGCEWSTQAHAASTGDVLGKHASKYPHDARLDNLHRNVNRGGRLAFGEGLGPTCPFGTHHVDGGVWNAWCVLVQATPAPRVAYVGNQACSKSK